MNKLQQIRGNAGGVDVGGNKIFVALPDGSVSNYGTFTTELMSAVQFLKAHQITSVAIESTGVYGVVLYEMLETAGIEVYLVNPGHLKYVPGRKTDVQDCQWLQQLHSYGLLKKSFVPAADIKILRSYVRYRQTYVEECSKCINRMQKALTLMNIRLHQVISQIHGISGMKVLKAILKGERDAEKLLGLCHESIVQNKREAVLASLQGNYREEHLFALQQGVDCYEFYQQKMVECDKKIDMQLKSLNTDKKRPAKKTPKKEIRHNKPCIENYHEKMTMLMNNQDLTVLPGITDYNLLQIVAEIGTDLSAWPTEKHFTSWFGLAPGKNTSGTLTKRAKKKAPPKAGLIFRQAAQTLLNSKDKALGHFARKLRARKGAYVAIKATARKLAVLFYRAATKGLQFVEQGISKYEAQIKETQLKSLMKKAKELNMMLVYE
jgi:transposase